MCTVLKRKLSEDASWSENIQNVHTYIPLHKFMVALSTVINKKKNVLFCFQVELLRVHSSPVKSGKGLAHGNYAKHASHVNDIKDTVSQSNKMAALMAGFGGFLNGGF